MAASPFALSPASPTRQFWRFGLLCTAFTVLWFIGSAYGLGDTSSFDRMLCHQLAAASAWGLRALGWVARTDAAQPTLLLLDNQPSVYVGAPCDGLVLYVLLAGFVLAYPGPAQRRLWFIPLGILALWLLNVIRIIALALNHEYSPETFDFDHHYAFSAVAYAALGGLWLLWTRQTSATPALVSGSLAAESQPTATRLSWLTTQVAFGLGLLIMIVTVSILRSKVLVAMEAGWATLLATGPAWLHRLPGATAGAMPAGVSRLALPVGVAYTGLFLLASLLIMRLLLADAGWRVAWRCYASLGLAYGLLLLAGRVSSSQEIYRIARMVLDFMVSLLPVAGLLVLLWRPMPTAGAAQRPLV